MGILDTIVKEAEEEASLPAEFVRTHAIAAGVLSYFYIRDSAAGGEEGLLQPEVEYVYDLPLPEDVVPKPNDDEVESFTLMPLHEVPNPNWSQLIIGPGTYGSWQIQTKLCDSSA
jgi:8-oxo-dGTP pyrophosphatase MutT (NUDIX family)